MLGTAEQHSIYFGTWSRSVKLFVLTLAQTTQQSVKSSNSGLVFACQAGIAFVGHDPTCSHISKPKVTNLVLWVTNRRRAAKSIGVQSMIYLRVAALLLDVQR